MNTRIQISNLQIYCIIQNMKKSNNLKLKSRASSTSSSGEKILKDQRIEELVASTFHCKDLFDKLLEQSSMVPEESQPLFYAHKTIADLNLSPRQSTQQGCKCSKIDCLKLYCQCFAKGKLCNESCICVCCHNTAGNQEEITQAKSVVNYRQPGYFQGVPEYIPTRKCTCKKSLCRKKYCECYNAGLKCTQQCQCFNCHNDKPQINYKFDSRMQIEVNA